MPSRTIKIVNRGGGPKRWGSSVKVQPANCEVSREPLKTAIEKSVEAG